MEKSVEALTDAIEGILVSFEPTEELSTQWSDNENAAYIFGHLNAARRILREAKGLTGSLRLL